MTETPKTPDQIKDERRKQIANRHESRLQEFADLLARELKRDGLDPLSLNVEFIWDDGPQAVIRNKGHRDIEVFSYGSGVFFCVGNIWGDSHDHYGDALIAAERKPSWLARLFGKGGAK